MSIFVKAIKPQRFKSDVFAQEIEKAQQEFANGVKEDFEKTVETWSEKPTFEVVTDVTGGEVSTLVATDNEIYGYVDEGTKPHAIFAGAYTGKSEKKTLAFSSEFVPKTTKGFIGSNPGSKGKVDTFRPYVQHPGTKAREFSKTIRQKWEKRYKKIMEKAMSTANKKSGYAI